MEAAIENRTSMHELPLEDIGTRVVKPNGLIPGGDEEVVAVVGEAEVGDAVGGGIGDLPPAAVRRKDGGAHGGGRRSERRGVRVLALGEAEESGGNANVMEDPKKRRDLRKKILMDC